MAKKNRLLFEKSGTRALIHVAFSAALLSSVGFAPELLPELLSPAFASVEQRVASPVLTSFMANLAANPRLMHIEYLKEVLGMPENWRSQISSNNKTFYWYSHPGHKLIYQLDQRGPRPDIVTESRFTAHLQDSFFAPQSLPSTSGMSGSRLFDHRGYPTDVHPVSSTTRMTFTQPQDSFRISEAAVEYAGPPLPAPTEAEIMALGTSAFHDLFPGKGIHRETRALSLLENDVRARPFDAYARIRLAEAYRKQSRINEAIGQYKSAMRFGSGRPDIERICLAAFKDLKVLPPGLPSRLPNGHPSRDYSQRGDSRVAGSGVGAGMISPL